MIVELERQNQIKCFHKDIIRYTIYGENGQIAGDVIQMKNSQNWFIPPSYGEMSYSAEELMAIAVAMQNLK